MVSLLWFEFDHKVVLISRFSRLDVDSRLLPCGIAILSILTFVPFTVRRLRSQSEETAGVSQEIDTKQGSGIATFRARVVEHARPYGGRSAFGLMVIQTVICAVLTFLSATGPVKDCRQTPDRLGSLFKSYCLSHLLTATYVSQGTPSRLTGRSSQHQHRPTPCFCRLYPYSQSESVQ